MREGGERRPNWREVFTRAMLEHSADVISILDPKGRVLYESPSVERLLGHSLEERIGANVFDYIHPEDVERVAAAFTEALATPETSRAERFRIRHADGSWRVLESTGRNCVHDPEVRGIVVSSRDVTDRAESEQMARWRAAAMLASMDGMAILDAQGRFLSVNPAHARIYGYDRPEALDGSSWSSLYSDAELRRLQVEMMPVLTRYGRWRGEAVGRRRDGSTFPQELSLSTLPDGGIVCVVRDITDRRQAEEELRASELRFRTVVEALGEGIVINDLEDRVVYCNSRLARMTGYSMEEMLRHRVGEFSPPEERDRLREIRALRMKGISSEYEIPVRRADGSEFLARVHGSPFRTPDGTIVGTVAVVEDISDRKRVELELVRAKDAAEAASEAKSGFLASMSHELRTPLNSVIGFAGVLLKNRRGNLGDQELKYLERIHANGRHLLGLIDDVLDLSRIEAGRMEVERRPVALDALVAETLDELSGALHGRPVELRSVLPDGLRPLVTDPVKFKQVLINLVGNAVKFTERGQVTVVVTADPATRRPLRVQVRDTGPGIPPGRLEAIFRAFEQAEGGIARRFGGTGLGLTISSALCALMGHRLEVASEPGVGSTFTLHLGVGAGPAPPAAEPAPGAVRAPEVAPGERLVLVIDDETDARTLLTHHLEDLGCQTISASSGPQGLRMAREFRPDLITLDLLLPGMNGWEILRALKGDPELSDIPVVIVSVVAGENRASILGAVDLLEKPIDRERLRSVLDRHLAPGAGRVLVVDGDREARERLERCLRDEGLEPRVAESGDEALRLLQEAPVDLVVLDLSTDGSEEIELLRRLGRLQAHRHVPVVVVTPRARSRRERRQVERLALAVLPRDDALEAALAATVRRARWTVAAAPALASGAGRRAAV